MLSSLHTGDAAQRCDGVLLERLQPRQLELIDQWMDKGFDRLVVNVTAEDGVGGRGEVEALMYVCPEEARHRLDEARPWSYADFRRQHLERVVEEAIKPVRAQFLADEAAARG